MILSDHDIDNAIRAKTLVVQPFSLDCLRENSLDLRLGDEIAVRNPKLPPSTIFDPANPEHIKEEYIVREKNSTLVIQGREQVLLSSQEYLKLPDDLMGFVELRSTLARHGLLIAPTIIDAGFAGNITLSVTNSAPYSIVLRPGLKFAHVVFAQLMNKATKSYKGAYLNQKGIWLPKPL